MARDNEIQNSKSPGRSRKENGAISVRKKQSSQGNKSYTSWEARVTTGYTADGKQQVKSFSGKTRTEAVEKARKYLAALQAGLIAPDNRITVGEWMTIWVEGLLNHLSRGAAHEYRRKAETYIIPKLGSIPLQQLSPLMVQAFINSFLQPAEDEGKALSPKYIRDIHGVLHVALEAAIEKDLLRRNPANGCSLPKDNSTPRHQYDTRELAAFLQAINGHIHERYYLVLLLTGMREAEVLGLTWDCIDFDRRTIHVRQQLQRDRDTGEYRVVTPKHGEFRCLAMSDALAAILKEQAKQEQEKQQTCGNCWQGKNLVFSNPTGSFLSYRTVYDCYKRIVKKIGLPQMRVHDLRHAFAMLALQNGDDVKTVQELLGHKTADFTLKVYAYTTNSAKQTSADRMGDALKELRG